MLLRLMKTVNANRLFHQQPRPTAYSKVAVKAYRCWNMQQLTRKKKGPKTFDKQHSRDATKFSLVCPRLSETNVLRSLRLSKHLPQLVTSTELHILKQSLKQERSLIFGCKFERLKHIFQSTCLQSSIKNRALLLKQTSFFLYNATFNWKLNTGLSNS